MTIIFNIIINMQNIDNVMQRFVCDQVVLEKIISLSQCKTCGKIALTNYFFNGTCHKGSFCQQCSSQFMCCKNKEQLNTELHSYLRQVKVRCINYTKGCLDLLTYDRLQKHEEDCPNRPKKSAPPSLQVKADPFIPKFDIPEMNRPNPMMINMGMAKPFPSFESFARPEEPPKDNLTAKLSLLESKIKEIEGKVNGFDGITKQIEECTLFT
jgi:hypothetical protein